MPGPSPPTRSRAAGPPRTCGCARPSPGSTPPASCSPGAATPTTGAGCSARTGRRSTPPGTSPRNPSARSTCSASIPTPRACRWAARSPTSAWRTCAPAVRARCSSTWRRRTPPPCGCTRAGDSGVSRPTSRGGATPADGSVHPVVVIRLTGRRQGLDPRSPSVHLRTRNAPPALPNFCRMTLRSLSRRATVLSVAVAGTVVVTACGAANETDTAGSDSGNSTAPQLSGDLVGAGSSAQQAAMQAWQAGFNSEQPGVNFSYDPVGSGGGREQFLAGGVDFAGSDSALSDEELASAGDRCGDAGVFELPNYISAIAVVYNLDGVDDLNLSPATLAGIFGGTITTWNDPAIAADNPDATLPATAITPVHRGDKSGTTKNFTDYLDQAAGDVWTAGAVEEWPTSGGEAANGTSGVIASVSSGQGAIGYADESQAGDLGVAKIKVGDEFVAPSPEAAAAVVANSDKVEGRSEYDLAVAVNRTTTSTDEYPIVLVSYHIGCVEYDDQAKADAVKAFESYVISPDGQQAAADNAGSSPITDDARSSAQPVIDAISASAG